MNPFDGSEELAQLARDVNTGQPVGIVLINPSMDENDPQAIFEIDFEMARVLVSRVK